MCISREGSPLLWPSSSRRYHHFTSQCGGYVKSIVYQSSVTRIDDPKKHITDAIMTIHANILLRTWQELEYRMEVRATNGAHIEVY